MSDLLTTSEVATKLQVTPRYISRIYRAGVITADLVVKRQPRFTLDKVVKQIADHNKKARTKTVPTK